MAKKILLLLFTALIFHKTTQAQSSDQHVAHFGFKIGFNISGFTGDVGPLDKNSPGYANGPFAGSFKDIFLTGHVGITADYRISRSFSFATEFLVNGRGGQYQIPRNDVVITDTAGNQTNGYDHYSYELYYVELPMILQYHITGNNGGISSRVYFGISPAIKIYAKTHYDYYQLAADSVTENINDQTSKVNYVRGFNVSPIFGIWIGSRNPGHGIKLFGDMRFEYTLLPVFYRDEADGENLKTNMWTLNLGMGVRF